MHVKSKSIPARNKVDTNSRRHRGCVNVSARDCLCSWVDSHAIRKITWKKHIFNRARIVVCTRAPCRPIFH